MARGLECGCEISQVNCSESTEICGKAFEVYSLDFPFPYSMKGEERITCTTILNIVRE